MTALCKSRERHACFSWAERTAKQALSTLYAKNATEQQGSAPEAQANASIAEMQYQVAIPDKCKTQKPRAKLQNCRVYAVLRVWQIRFVTISLQFIYRKNHSDLV